MNIYDLLNKLNIKYDEVQHKAVYTIEEALNEKIADRIKGVECKNLFVKSKTNYYLIFMCANKKCNLKEISNLVNDTKLSFASLEELNDILKLDLGSVTPLGIINDKDNKVKLLLDKELIDKKVLMHPNVNTKTISLKFNDLIKIIEYTNHDYYMF